MWQAFCRVSLHKFVRVPIILGTDGYDNHPEEDQPSQSSSQRGVSQHGTVFLAKYSTLKFVLCCFSRNCFGGLYLNKTESFVGRTTVLSHFVPSRRLINLDGEHPKQGRNGEGGNEKKDSTSINRS